MKAQAPFIVSGDDSRPTASATAGGMRHTKTIQEVLRNEWKKTIGQVWPELKTTRWGRVMIWLLLLAWMSLLFTALVMIPLYTTSSYAFGRTACAPDGSFNLNPSNTDAWALSGFFQVTLAFGTLSFSQAKLIDIAWDLAVGRGGQIIMAWLSWKVFAIYVAMSMQVQPVTLETFWIVFFGAEPGILQASRLIRDFSVRRGLVSKPAMGFIIFSIGLTVLFPTLASAMTGYTTLLKAFVPEENGNLVPYSEFSPVVYTIHDGNRINLTTDYNIKRHPFTYVSSEDVLLLGDTVFPYGYDSCRDFSATGETRSYQGTDCHLRGNLSEYVSKYGFFGLTNEKTMWMNTTLDAPSLNISASFLYSDQPDFGWNWTDPRTKLTPFSNASASVQLVAASNGSYTVQYIQENGTCKPQDVYRWGFSAWQLIILLVLLFCWCIGTYAMWLKAHLTLDQRGGLEVPGRFKSALQFANALQTELMGDEKDLDTYTEEEMQKRMARFRKGGAVSMEPSASNVTFSFWRGLCRWSKREKWWILTLCAATGIFLLLLIEPGELDVDEIAVHFFGPWSLCAIIAVSAAMVLGRTTRTRLFYVTLGMLAGLVAIIMAILTVPNFHVRR